MTTLAKKPGQIHSPAAKATGGPAILGAHDLYKTYTLGRINVPVLNGVSISIPRGECVAILGASGSGKSTLMHLLGGLDRPDKARDGLTRCPHCRRETSSGLRGARCPECSQVVVPVGDVDYEGRRLAEMGARGLDRYRNTVVGFVFQFYHLLPELNVSENVLIPAMVRYGRFGYMRRKRELRAAAAALLDSFGLSHRLRHRPAELSGGERQRVAIARALINDPPILLADEPTGNLDHKTGQSILDQIAAHRSKTNLTLVIVTHDTEVASRADRVVRLVDGKVVFGPE